MMEWLVKSGISIKEEHIQLLRKEDREAQMLELIVRSGKAVLLDKFLVAKLNPHLGVGVKNEPPIYVLSRLPHNTLLINVFEIIEILLKHGVNPQAPIGVGKLSPVQVAIEKQNAPIVKFYIAHGYVGLKEITFSQKYKLKSWLFNLFHQVTQLPESVPPLEVFKTIQKRF